MTEQDNKKWCVYMHVNKINDKKYIGITSRDVEQRWRNGCGYCKDQPVFWNAIKKYGWDNFKHEIIARDLSEYDAKQLEIHLIDKYKTNCRKYKNPEYGYNMTDGGDGTTGRLHTEETKEKIRNAAIGRKASEETKLMFSKTRQGENNSFYGKHHTEETKKILSDKHKEYLSNPENHGMYGKHHSEESKRKNMEAQLKKEVVQLNKNGEFVAEFISINEASRCTGIPHLNISRCCRHIPHHNTAGGYFWLFKSEYDELLKMFNGFEIIQYLYPNIALNVNGVSFRNDKSKWVSRIRVNGKDLFLGYFANKDDAIRSRLEAEARYFGEFAPQQRLFEQYGITIQNELEAVNEL